MKPDSMLVEPDYIITTREEIAKKGTDPSFEEFGQTEPVLASFIHESLATVAGKLALSGAPTSVVQGSNEDLLGIVLTCVNALRRGRYELWKDAMTGTPMARVTPSRHQPSRVQKKSRKSVREPEEEVKGKNPGFGKGSAS
jgi:hypothetical protein